tara:strand:- start:305 stop:517 length:213 start_codon:yes stop_codon:yes gene_type:complete
MLKVEVLVPDGPEHDPRDCETVEEGSGIVVVVVVVTGGGGFGLTVLVNPESNAFCSLLHVITVFPFPSES